MAKIRPQENFVKVVERSMAQNTPEAIRQRRAVTEVLDTINAMRAAQPTEDSDRFPFYQSDK